LGRACSLVRARLADEPVTPNHIPDQAGNQTLRVVGEGSLEELEGLYKRNLRPNVSGLARYRRVSGDEKPEPLSGCFREMLILRKTGGIGMPIESALTVTDATRNALLKLADGNDAMCDMLSGHGAHPHCAFAALPFAGYPHASGNLMGVAVILPSSIDAASRRKVLATCALLERINLRDALGDWTVELANFDIPQKTLQTETWMKAAKKWTSVTPVLLDRFPKKNLGVEEILRTACERVGLPSPVEVEHSPYSDVEGVPAVPEFRLLRSGDERARWGVHVRLTFDRPVRGPILIGAGRYFGLGLMKADL
jgi:CRISPR-associated protein Csb2